MPPRHRASTRAVHPDLYAAFRRRLVEAREAAGLTQRDAAVRLGRSQSYVAKSESGERRVDVIELLQFATAYGRAPEYFFPNPQSASHPGHATR